MDAAQDPPSPGDEAVSSLAATPELTSSSSSSAKRKRQPRNSACQGCAALKMKCITTPNGKCERCLRMDRSCIPAVPKPRKRRTESGVSVDGDGIPLLDFEASVVSTAVVGPPPKFDPPRASLSANHADKASLLARPDLSHDGSQSFTSLFSHGLGNVAALEELLLGIDYNFMSNSFNMFRQLASAFPFVELSVGADVISMVAKRPVLTLAICTVTSGSNSEVQTRLSRAFQYALASKVVLGSERSMDVFTGLLVYLAWHHQYMSQHNIYQELYLLAGMAADLGLYRPRSESIDPTSTLERDRAFVGCYYLSCSLAATGFDRPSPLRWSDNLRACAENAAAAGTLPSDRSMVSILELVHALDDMEEGLRQDTVISHSNPTLLIELQTTATSQRLKALKREHPTLSGSLGFSSAAIHIYQRLLRASDTPDYSTLIQCACAIKEYIDDVLARPPTTLHHLAIVDWTNLTEILVLMARISKPLPTSNGREAGALTSVLHPEMALDSICAHMASAPARDPLFPRHESLLSRLRTICDGIKRKVLHEDSTGRSQESQQCPTSNVRFRPLNEQQQQQAQSQSQQPEAKLTNTSGAINDAVRHDGFKIFGNGVLDPSFLNSITS